MPEFPKLIEVERKGKSTHLVIDGEEFPYFIAEDGIGAQVRSDEMPAITLTVYADEVRVIDVLT